MKEGGERDVLFGAYVGCVHIWVPGECLSGRTCTTELVQGVEDAGGLRKKAMTEVQ